MTVQDIEQRIEEMKTYDDEVAHRSEDAMREEVLEAIANGAPNAAELARAALKSSELDFSRWTA